MRLFIKRAITDKDPENYYGKGCVLEPFGVLLYSHMQVVDCFKVIRKDLASVNGGLGDLAQADMRTAERKQYIDQHRYEMLMIGGKGLVTFLKYAYQHDKLIAAQIHLDNIKFYEKFSWARTSDMISTREALSQWADETLHDAGRHLDSVCRFMRRHKEAIIEITIGVVIVAGLVVATVLTGGFAAAGIVALMAKGALTMSLFGAAMGIGFGFAKGAKGGQIFEAAADGFMFGAIGGMFFGAGSFIAAGGAGAGTAGYLTFQTGSKFASTAAGILVRAGGGIIADMTGHMIRTGSTSMSSDYTNGLMFRTAVSVLGDCLGFGMASRFTQIGVTVPTINMGLKFKGLSNIGKNIGKMNFVKNIKLPKINENFKKVFINDIQKINGKTVIKFNPLPWQNDPFTMDPKIFNFAERTSGVITGYVMPSTGTILSHAYSSDGAANFLLGDTLSIDLNFKPINKPLDAVKGVSVPDVPKVSTEQKK